MLLRYVVISNYWGHCTLSIASYYFEGPSSMDTAGEQSRSHTLTDA
jgi:hypothetical protein